MTWPKRCLRMTGRTRTGDVHRAKQSGRELPVHLLRRQLFEEASVEVASVIDKDVDATEAFNGGLNGGLRHPRGRDVEGDGE